MELKNFQKIAIDQLSNSFLDLWKTEYRKIPLVFKAPTGSGKTIMMAEFLRCLDDNYQFHEDKAYIWISFGGDESYMQSKKKLYDYFNEGTDMSLKDVNNFNEGKLYKSSIFFINWSKIKASNKEGRKLRKPNENTDKDYGIFDEFIYETKKEREIVLIIDEAHREAGENLSLYQEIINLIDPKIIIKVTATPEDVPSNDDILDKKAGYIRVKEEDVIESGLIKEKIVIQTQEDIEELERHGLGADEIMLELAFNKRIELQNLYNELGLDINPLVLIQLPSDEREQEEVTVNKKNMVLSYLHSKEVPDDKIAVWLSNEKKNLEFIEKNNNSVDFMIFKVAPATGWDCPRADILVMFREINNPSFHTQIIGRIKRMPEGHHYNVTKLNSAYLYTNYSKNNIKDIRDPENGNKIPIYFTELKNGISSIVLETTFHHRTDFNTITPPDLWQKTFSNVFDEFFGTKIQFFDKNVEQVKNKINLKCTSINNQIIVNAEINSFDNFINEIKEKSSDLSYQFSELDIERLYNLLCFEELKKQDVEDAKYNASRSWSQLKSAINVWFETRLNLEREKWYIIAVNELLNENSELKRAIHKALITFRELYNITIKEKEETEIFNLNIPEEKMSFTDDFETLEVTKNVYKDFYIRKEYLGRKNETKFIQFLESQNIDWWHKQSDGGRSVFAVEYFDNVGNKRRLFYPDFIIKKGEKIYLLDTKSEETAMSTETADKNKGLQKWIKDNKGKYTFEIIGGIVDFSYPEWKINRKEDYVYENKNDWEKLILE